MPTNATIVIFVVLQVGLATAVVMRFTNLKCLALDPPFATFEKCQLKLIRRGVSALNIHVKLHKVPVTNSSINIGFFKRFSGYRPFMYNLTFDFCKAMKYGSRQLSIYTILYNITLRHSNINHTCPYNDDIIVKNLTLDDEMFRYLPLPEGNYMLKIVVGAYNSWKADVQAFFSFS